MSYLTHGSRRRRRDALEASTMLAAALLLLVALWALIVYLAALAWGLA